ncbi:MAG: hypothetical protein AB1765_04300 [Candidatus Hydrogenedentota bacterium]
MDNSDYCEITDLKLLTRAELREFCLQIVYQKSGDKRFERVIKFLTDLAIWLQKKDLTFKQLKAFQKIIDNHKLGYIRVGYLKRSKDDLSRSIERTKFYPTSPKHKEDSTYKYEKIRRLFLEVFEIADITGVEILQQLEQLSKDYSYEEIEDAFLRLRSYRMGKTISSIIKIIHNARSLLASKTNRGEKITT